MIGKSHKLALCHDDRWRVEDMLRVVWVHPVTRIARKKDDWPVWEGAQDGSQQERL